VDEEPEKILASYPDDRIRRKADCLLAIREILSQGVTANDLHEAVRDYACESAGFTRSKVCFSDNWFSSDRWQRYVQDARLQRETTKAKEAEALKGLAVWITERSPLCRHISPSQIAALLAAEMVTPLQIQAAGLG
jgi:hypothetical protein